MQWYVILNAQFFFTVVPNLKIFLVCVIFHDFKLNKLVSLQHHYNLLNISSLKGKSKRRQNTTAHNTNHPLSFLTVTILFVDDKGGRKLGKFIY